MSTDERLAEAFKWYPFGLSAKHLMAYLRLPPKEFEAYINNAVETGIAHKRNMGRFTLYFKPGSVTGLAATSRSKMDKARRIWKER